MKWQKPPRKIEPCKSCPRAPGGICDWHQGLIAAREAMEAAEQRMALKKDPETLRLIEAEEEADRKAAGEVP